MKAKEKLNLQEPGEKVIVLSSEITKSQQEIVPTSNTITVPSEKSVPNLQAWWNYFFANNNQ
jgi:hypothetical protein